MSQQFYTNFAPVGHWGVPQTLNNARNTSNSRCKRSVCSRPFQLEYTSDKSAIAVVQKDDRCWRFGQPGRCGSWNILIAAFTVAAGTDFLLVIFKSFLGNENLNKSARMQRYASKPNTQKVLRMQQVCISIL